MPRKKGSQRSKFGEWIDRILQEINEGNKLALSRMLAVEAYTQENLADAANIAQNLMSKYCSTDPKTGAPRLLPPRHVVMKIVAVLGVSPEDAYEALELTGHSINRQDSAGHFAYYQKIVNSPECKPQGKRDLIELTERINVLLIQAVKGEQGYRGKADIDEVFRRM